MRIAFFHELPKGGARIALSEIAHGLSKKHEVDLYYVDDESNKSEEAIYNKSYFFRFIPKPWKGNNAKVRIYKDTRELFNIDRLHKKIAKLIDSKKYDLVFVNASKYIEAPFILRHLKTLSVFYLHDPHFRVVYEHVYISEPADPIRRYYEKVHRKILKIIDRNNILKASYLIANSKFTKKTTYKSYGIDSEVGYLGTDTKFFKPSLIVEKDIDVLYIGSKDVLDGYPVLVKIKKFLDGKVKIRTLFNEDEWLAPEQIRELYRRSRIVLCLAVNEPFGLLAIEAASVGVPVIAIDEGGYKETIINGKTGYLVKRDPKNIAKKIMNILTNPKKMDLLSKNSRTHALKNWSWDKKISNISDLLEKIIKL